MKRALIVILGICLFVTAAGLPGCKRNLSEEEKKELAKVNADLKSTQAEIEQAIQDDARYTGGLIKALIAIRLEVLKTNEALLKQRIHQIESGAPVETRIPVSKPDSARVTELEKEVAQQKAKVEEAQAESDKYSGGLVKGFAEVTVATEKQTLAMLHQQYLASKYGLAIPAIKATDEPKDKRDEKDSPL